MSPKITLSEEEINDNDDDEEEEEEESGLFDNLYSEPNAELDPKRRRSRKGHLNAGLRRWMAEHKRGVKHHIKRRHRRARTLDPKRRHRRYRARAHDPKRRFHKRKYDIMGMSPMWSAVFTPLAVALGTWGHNFAYSRGLIKGSIQLPLVNANITTLGLGSGLLSSLLVYFGRGRTLPSLLAHIAAGSFGEGFNIPAVEGLSVSRGGTSTGMGGYGGLSIPEYVVARPY